MAKKFIPLMELEVAGYADPRGSNMLPAIMPPVFRYKDEPSRVLVPPYAFASDHLCDATEIEANELERLCHAGEVEMLPEPFAAKPNHSLWQDETSRCYYEPSTAVRRKLDGIAAEKVKQAVSKLRSGELELADQLAGAAVSASGREMTPFAIKAAIYRVKNELSSAGVMQELSGADAQAFQALVGRYSGMIATGSTSGHANQGPMRGMGCLRPELALAAR